MSHKAAVLAIVASVGIAFSPAQAQVGSLSGTIGIPAGSLAPEYAIVNLFAAETGTQVGLAYTDASLGWSYELGGLSPGDFKVHFWPAGGTSSAEWWPDAADQATASAVSVAAGSTTTVNPTLNLRRTTILWRESSSGDLYAWQMEGATQVGGEPLSPSQVPTNWEIAGTGDFDGDARPDILWREAVAGNLYVWYMDGATQTGGEPLSPMQVPVSWQIAAVRDFNGDGKPDLLWREETAGLLYLWYMDGATQTGGGFLSPLQVPVNWAIAGTGDFNGDGKPDILWREAAEGYLYVMYLDGATQTGGTFTSPMQVAANWQLSTVGDFNGDGKPDLLWREAAEGLVYLWFMDGVTQTGGTFLSPNQVPTSWEIAGSDVSPSLEPVEFGTCESCHDGTVAMAPDVPYYTVNGHGTKSFDPDGVGPLPLRGVTCADCHDVATPSPSTHLNGSFETYAFPGSSFGAPNSNTAHLSAAYFGAVAAEQEWQLNFDDNCYRNANCHGDPPARGHRHEMTHRNGVIRFGDHATVADPKRDRSPGPYWTPWTIHDITTDAPPPAKDYAPCVACHDPHGADYSGYGYCPDTPDGNHHMLRKNNCDIAYFCNSNCHRL